MGDFCGLDVRERRRHRGVVLIGRRILREGYRRGDTLGHARGGDDMDVDVGKFLCLFRSKDDVGVVGQHEHFLRLGRVDRAQDVVDAGVHGLTTFQCDVHLQILKDRLHAVAGADRHHAVRLQLLLLIFFAFALTHQLAVPNCMKSCNKILESFGICANTFQSDIQFFKEKNQ